jgi:diacylglycerol kinase
MRTFIFERATSFRHAFDGGWHIIRREPNARIHAAAALLVVGLGAWLRLAARDWAVLVLAIGGVVALEAMNTAVERAVDLACPDDHPLAKITKDVAAAAVLIGAAVAVVIGLLILGPPLWERVVRVVER